MDDDDTSQDHLQNTSTVDVLQMTPEDTPSLTQKAHCFGFFRKRRKNAWKYFSFNIAGICLCVVLAGLFALSFLIIAGKSKSVYYLDYHESILDMRSNALLTTVNIDAPEFVQTCFVSSLPSTVKPTNV